MTFDRRSELHARAEANHDKARDLAIVADKGIARVRNPSLYADMHSLASIAHSLNALVALKLREIEDE